MAPPSVLAALKLSLCGALLLLKSAKGADGPDYPPHWKEAPGKLTDFPKQNNQIVINPWNYLDRLGMVKILLKSTNSFFDMLGVDHKRNVLWIRALLIGWHFESGRFADPSKNTQCGYNSGDLFCISSDSYLASVDYAITIAPFLAAAEAGLIEGWNSNVQILPPENHADEFCYSIPGCHTSTPNLMNKWDKYFEHLESIEPVSGDKASGVIDKLLGQLWNVREKSIDIAIPSFDDRLQFLSDSEADFAKGFLFLQQFYAHAHFVSDFPGIKGFVAALPPRMLTNNDEALHITDFTDAQNIFLFNLRRIRVGNNKSGGKILELWIRLTCTEEGRDRGHQRLNDMRSTKLPSVEHLIEMLAEEADDLGC